MRLMLMRHGEAESVFSRDSERALTSFGKEEVGRAAQRMCEQRLLAARTVASPYRRAVETASIVTDVLELPGALTSVLLTPETDPSSTVQMLAEQAEECHSLLAVLHQPLISRLVLHLSGDVQPMSTASVAVLEGETLDRESCELICVL